MNERKTLLTSDSPLCPVQAVVEQTENAVYFYLFYIYGEQGKNLRACWVCNCREAPDALDAGDKLSMMPKGCFSHDPKGITVNADKLMISWFPDGDSAALLEGGNILAIIPPKAGLYDFPGFARYAVGQQRYAWELSAEQRMQWMELIAQSDTLFEHTRTREFWNEMQKKHLQMLEGFFGAHTGYYAIDDNKYPLRAVIEGRKDGATYGITAFLSIFPQPQIEVYVRDAAQHRRIEFGFAAVDAKADQVKKEAYNCFMSLAKYIYRDRVFFAHGHTNTWEGIPGFAAFLFVNARAIRGMEMPPYGAFLGDPINLLWAVPITQAEYDFAVQNSTDALLRRAKDLTRIHIFDGTPKFAL